MELQRSSAWVGENTTCMYTHHMYCYTSWLGNYTPGGNISYKSLAACLSDKQRDACLLCYCEIKVWPKDARAHAHYTVSSRSKKTVFTLSSLSYSNSEWQNIGSRLPAGQFAPLGHLRGLPPGSYNKRNTIFLSLRIYHTNSSGPSIGISTYLGHTYCACAFARAQLTSFLQIDYAKVPTGCQFSMAKCNCKMRPTMSGNLSSKPVWAWPYRRIIPYMYILYQKLSSQNEFNTLAYINIKGRDSTSTLTT